MPALELRNVSKAFGPTRALDDVSFDVAEGEVHVLAGENGAGKSTLIRILSGVHTDFSGELLLNGRPVRFSNPAEAALAGIATIHQELSLLPNLSIADNVLLAMPGRAAARVRAHEAFAKAKELLEVVGLALSPHTLVETLPLGDRQLIEIARALGRKARVLVMDEPTSALSEPEALRLFERIDRLREGGTAILYISHRMEEIYRLADRITVLRDGKRLFSRAASELPPESLVLAMAGKELASERRDPKQHALGAPVLSVRALAAHGNPPLQSLAFDVQRGEIVGLCGLRGSGASRTLYTVFGASKAKEADIRVGGAPYVPRSPRHAIRSGLMLLPSDRAASIFPELSVQLNATLSSLRRVSSALSVLDIGKEHASVAARIPELSLKAPSMDAPAWQLSGGNQQKLALLRCLLVEPRVLLLDDPTRGVDVGAKADIHRLLAARASQGMAILIHSTDLEELCHTCDRVLVFFQGRLVREVRRAELSRERLLRPVMGGAA